MQRTKAPFRADHVGSLLRPAPLKQARAKHEKGEINAKQLAEIEDREIEKVVKKQEEVGLKLATDGELRRSWWQFDFYKGLDGVELYSTGKGITFYFKAGDQVVTATAAKFDDVEFITYRSDLVGSVSCGPAKEPMRVYLTWRAGPGEGTKLAVAIEFLPPIK